MKKHSVRKNKIRNHLGRILFGFKQINFRRTWIPIIQKIFIILLPLSFIIYFIIIHIFDLGIGDTFKICLGITFISPALFFLIDLIKKNRNKNLAQDSQEFYQNKRTNYYAIFLSLLTFYATFFIGLLIFQEKPASGEIPYLKDGTIGMRAWQCQVIVRNIQIHYHDSLGIWRKIPDSIVYDSTNWTKTLWNSKKVREQILDLDTRGWKQKIRKPKKLTVGDSIQCSFSPKDSSFLLQNCVLVFNPIGCDQKIFHDIRFDCEVSFEKINRPIDFLFPGFQLITFIDTSLVVNDKGVKDFSDLCLQFNLGMNCNHILWIPALDYEPPVKYVSTINKMAMFGNYNSIEEKKLYKIAAIVLEDKVLFLGLTNGSVKLFEAQLATKKTR